jgi:hypothetical protein
MTTTVSVLLFALLFALFGVMRRPQPKCSSNCGSCENACATAYPQDES